MARKMRDLMSSAPVCLAATESVSAAARAMKDHGIGTALSGVCAAPPSLR
jgi:CBS domain-containing protein